MDKLKPILEYKFWILLVPALIAPFVGWWMTTGALASVITTRKSALDSAEKAIPATSDAPNEDWSQKLTALNVQQKKAVEDARRLLWLKQKAVMTWPDAVSKEPNAYMPKVKWKDKIPSDAATFYRLSYDGELERVWRTLNPLDMDTGKGIAYFPRTKMPQVNPEVQLSSDEIWILQEDLWLYESVFKVLNGFNGGFAATRQDATVHVIDRFEFRGGDRAKMGTVPASGPGAAAAGPAAAHGGSQFGPGMGLGAATNTVQAGTVEFDPAEEFGPTGATTGAAFGGSMAAMAHGGPGGPAPAAAANLGRRYIDDEKGPYRSRGLYLSLLMDHRRVPDLLIELMANEDNPFPIEILRVHMERINDDSKGQTGGGLQIAGGASPFGPPGMSEGAHGGPPGYPGGSPFGSPHGGAHGGSPFGGSPSFGHAGEDGGAFGGSPFGNQLGGIGAGPTTIEGGTNPAAQAAVASLNNALADANMARVTIACLLIMYNPQGDEVLSDEEQAAKAAAAAKLAAPVVAPAAEVPAATPEASSPTNDGATAPEADPATTEMPAATEGDTEPEMAVESESTPSTDNAEKSQ